MNQKDFITTKGMLKDDILSLLETTESFYALNKREIKKVPTLRGKSIVNLFFENSTRTKNSFEIAGKRLSADVINFSAGSSSVNKGETLMDTVKNIEAMNTDILVLRHMSSGAAKFVAEHTHASVINAGDGANEHPTQAMLDMFTIRKIKGMLEGLTVTIAGDITHSRVARSDIWAMQTMGMNVKLFAPPTMIPNEPSAFKCEICRNKREALDADILITLRIQRERQSKVLIPSLREYSYLFGFSVEDLKYAPKHLMIMHPGPVNRGVELSSYLADGGNSAILDQVESGVSVRMAVLCMLRA
jgi:aspartate carbamoyltransferase catalytic subunit